MLYSECAKSDAEQFKMFPAKVNGPPLEITNSQMNKRNYTQTVSKIN